LLWTNGKWKGPLGMRSWRKGGPAKVALAIGLLRQARRRGLQPAYVLSESWYAAAEIMNLLDGWGWHYGRRLKRNRKFGGHSLGTIWPQRYGHAQGALRGVDHPVCVGKDGRRYWGDQRSDPPWPGSQNPVFPAPTERRDVSLAQARVGLGQLFVPKTPSAVGTFTLRIVCACVNSTDSFCAWTNYLRVPTVVICPIHPAKSFGPTGVYPGCVISDA